MPNKSKKQLARNITARPKSVADEMTEALPGDESGLSLDADELGARFLSEATETGTRRRPQQLRLTDAPPGDGALFGPNFDSEQSVWENTVDLTREGRDGDESSLDASGDDAITLDLSREHIREAMMLVEDASLETRLRAEPETRKH